MDKKRSIALERQIQVYPDKVTVYPGKISSIAMIIGFKNLYCESNSEAIDKLISIAFNTMPKSELERIRSHAKLNDGCL